MKAATVPNASPNTPPTGSGKVIAWPLAAARGPLQAGCTMTTEAIAENPPALAMQLACLRTCQTGVQWYGLAGTG